MTKLFRRITTVCIILPSLLSGVSVAHDIQPFDFSEEAGMGHTKEAGQLSELHDAARDLHDTLAKLIEVGELSLDGTDIGAEAITSRLDRLSAALDALDREGEPLLDWDASQES